MSTFWEDVAALSPTVMWMARESSGTSIADDSGNSKTGTVSGTPTTMGDTSLITNLPTEASIKMPGGSVWIYRADESALDVTANNFTAIVTIKAANLSAQRDIIGKLDCWQIWQETSGRLTAYFTPAWTSVLSSNDSNGKIVAGNVEFLVIRQDGSGAAEASVWIGHQGGSLNKVGSTTKSNNLTNSTGQLRMAGSSNSGAGRSFNGNIQAFAYWPGTALSDANLASLFSKWDTAATPTTPDPPSITDPTNGESFDAGFLITVAEDGTNPGENGTPEFKVEYNLNSGGWTTLIDWIAIASVTDYVIDTSGYANGTLELRAYERRSASTVSAASTTVTVTIDHTSPNLGIKKPVIAWEMAGLRVLGAYSDAYSNTDPLAAALSRWQIADYGTDFAECHTETGTLGAAMQWTQDGTAFPMRFGVNDIQDAGGGLGSGYSLDDDRDYEIRMQWEDELGNTSEWSDAVRAKTAIAHTLPGSGLLADDQQDNNDGVYTQSASSAGTPEAKSATICIGQRFPYHRISGGATEYGVLCDNQNFIYKNGLTNAHNSPSPCPNWRFKAVGWLAFDAVGVGHGYMGLQDSGGNVRLYVYQPLGGNLKVEWHQNGGGVLGSGPWDCGEAVVAGQPFSIEIEWDGTSFTYNTSTTLYTPGTQPELNLDIAEVFIGHHSCVGPSLAGAYHMMEGIWLSMEFEWNGTLVLNWTAADPYTPNAPTVTKV